MMVVRSMVTKILVNCWQYYLEGDSGHDIRLELLTRYLARSFLPGEGVHRVLLTVVDIMCTLYVASTAKGVERFKRAST